MTDSHPDNRTHAFSTTAQIDLDNSIGLPGGRWWRQPGDRPLMFHTALRTLRNAGGTRLLDVGCGQGQFLRRASRHFEAYGVDVSPMRVACARQVTGLSTITVGSAMTLRFPERFFDIVCALDVVEHLDKPALFFAEASRVLRPHGTLLFSTPNTSSFGHRRKGDSSFMHRDPTHVSLLEPDSWRGMVAEHEFTVVRDGTDSLWDPPYFDAVPARLQRYTFFALAQLGFLIDVMFPWRWGENYWCLARAG